jgi:hypothetical protein
MKPARTLADRPAGDACKSSLQMPSDVLNDIVGPCSRTEDFLDAA